jgi:CheY-like chemotaxis protein
MEVKASDKVWLVAEDDPTLRAMLTAMVTIWDRTPLVFSDGNQVMTWLDQVENGEARGQIPEFALLDVRMPGRHGPEIAQRMRRTPATAGMPIIIMTAYRLQPEEREQIMQQGQPDRLIGKPLPPPDTLKILFEEVIRERRGREGPSKPPPEGPVKGAPPEKQNGKSAVGTAR